MVFRSEDVPAADRLAFWAERMGNTHAPVRLRSDHAHDFRASQRVLALGAVSVWPATFQQVVIRRTPQLIRRSDPELCHFSLVMRGTGTVDWDGHEAAYRPLDLHINDSSVPWEVRTGRAPVTAVGVEIPKALLPLEGGLAVRRLPGRMPAHEGIGALLAQFLTQLISDTTPYQPTDGARLGSVLVDLCAALLAHGADAEHALSKETHSRTLILRVQRFILEHLHNPQLTPSAIAAAHHISISYLHRLFQREEATVAAWIRRRRLEAARRDLADPALRTLPVHAIATRWGFSRAADFSRAFRTAYGTPPRDYRSQAASS
ncbi:helix-turn-helix domain-containing protein [Streptomyces sp. CB02959]|uniref:helix-turn-helix domain-containing protein n=1 Tax=Streptomyces sp. CB02959 TaxID=2020330 RepID=UPI0021529DFB|nr:helix-turn-helix domain-containing protein [Streptomyces sp. CB02959]